MNKLEVEEEKYIRRKVKGTVDRVELSEKKTRIIVMLADKGRRRRSDEGEDEMEATGKCTLDGKEPLPTEDKRIMRVL